MCSMPMWRTPTLVCDVCERSSVDDQGRVSTSSLVWAISLLCCLLNLLWLKHASVLTDVFPPVLALVSFLHIFWKRTFEGQWHRFFHWPNVLPFGQLTMSQHWRTHIVQIPTSNLASSFLYSPVDVRWNGSCCLYVGCSTPVPVCDWKTTLLIFAARRPGHLVISPNFLPSRPNMPTYIWQCSQYCHSEDVHFILASVTSSFCRFTTLKIHNSVTFLLLAWNSNVLQVFSTTESCLRNCLHGLALVPDLLC